MIGPAVPVAAFVIVTSFTAEAVVTRMIPSFPFASAMNPPEASFGAVSVLFVRVSAPAIAESVPVVGRVTSVAPEDVSVIAFAPTVMRLDPSTRVRVADVVGAVIVTLLTVLFVKASVVAFPTRVSVASGSVTVRSSV